jgi:hypothetical protein
MASYININGNNIPIRASDPSNPILGEIWYNTTSNTLKGYVFESSAFSTQNAMPTATRSGAGAGTETAGLAWCGDNPGGRANQTYEYDGTNWTSGGSYPSSLTQVGGGGSQTSAIGVGGFPPSGISAVNEYNGSTWSGGTSYPTAVRNGDGGGPSVPVSYHGGGEIVNTGTNAFNLYDGTSWTAGAANPTADFNKFCGTQTATLAVANGPGATQTFDGAAWTTVNPALGTTGAGMYGDQTTAVNACANPSGNPTAQEWDGTCWSNGATPSQPGLTSRQTNENGTVGLFAGGFPASAPPNDQAFTEEYTAAAAATVTISSS